MLPQLLPLLWIHNAELQWRQWNIQDLAVLIAVGIQHKMTSPILFKLLFKYFDPVSDAAGHQLAKDNRYCTCIAKCADKVYDVL